MAREEVGAAMTLEEEVVIIATITTLQTTIIRAITDVLSKATISLQPITEMKTLQTHLLVTLLPILLISVGITSSHTIIITLMVVSKIEIITATIQAETIINLKTTTITTMVATTIATIIKTSSKVIISSEALLAITIRKISDAHGADLLNSIASNKMDKIILKPIEWSEIQ